MQNLSQRTVIPPVVFLFTTTSGLCLFNRMPTASNSISSSLRCSVDFVASSIMIIKSAVFATVGDEYDYFGLRLIHAPTCYHLSSTAAA